MSQPERSTRRHAVKVAAEASSAGGTPETSSELERALHEWQADVRGPNVAKHGERSSEFTTQALHWPVAPLYTPLDLEAAGFDYAKDLGFPGQYPYTRGTEPNGHRTRLWTMAQVTGFGRGQDWAKRARFMLEQGLQGLILEHDLPTTNGYDSDNPLVAGEVGRAGLAIDALPDVEAALDVPFDKLKYLMSVCNAPQPVNLAMILAALERKGVDPRTFTLHMVNGILIEYICVGRYIYPPKHGLRIATDVIEHVVRHHPNWMPISIIGAQLYAARANPVQELAWSMAIAAQYIDATLERGIDIDTLAPYFHFVTGVDMDFFEAVCKLRVYRKLWARMLRERYGAKKPESLKIRIMSSPGTMSLTLQQPLNNISRLSMMALACALGGAGEAMTTPLHDEAHALPSEDAIRVGAAIQHIVAHETGVVDTIDPLAGSYYIESLTKRMEDAALAEMAKIEAMGGTLAAIEQGYFQRALGHEQFERNRALENGTRKLVGVNHLAVEAERREIDLFRLDSSTEQQQIERLRKLRAERDAARVTAALAGVRTAAADGTNLVVPILEAVRAHATHGEICDAMRDVFGVHSPDAQTCGV
jgi:methylmalonyl-CoA mutase N-terminal domain/subunit